MHQQFLDQLVQLARKDQLVQQAQLVHKVQLAQLERLAHKATQLAVTIISMSLLLS
jgi:hypothetical protein